MMPAPDEVCVYWLTAAPTQAEEAHCASLLSHEERIRTAAFVRDEPRRQFVVARAALRIVLGRALGVTPGGLPLRIGANGKPETDGLHFNLSHADDLVAVAVSSDASVGVDVEPWSDEVECLEIARQAFAAADLDLLYAAEPAERQRIFFDLWTQREAVAKCLGTGIADPAALRGELPSDSLRIDVLALLPRVSAAVAVARPSTRVKCERLMLAALLADTP